MAEVGNNDGFNLANAVEGPSVPDNGMVFGRMIFDTFVV